jgi:hypothetical protein
VFADEYADHGAGMRRCGRCGRTRPLAEFQLRRRKTGALQTWCRGCMGAYKQDWYVRNREHQLRQVKKNQVRTTRENQERAWSYLGEHPCVDCGESDPVVLQFDHVRGKRKEVSKMLRSGFTWPTVSAEIDKCEVRCGNCHRRKTAREQGFFDRKSAQPKLEETAAAYRLPDNWCWAVSSVDRASAF